MKFYIKLNTPELQSQLKGLGYHLCECVAYEGADWLVVDTRENPQVHGWGYNTENMIGSQAKKVISHDRSYTNFGLDQDKFLELAREKSPFLRRQAHQRGYNREASADKTSPAKAKPTTHADYLPKTSHFKSEGGRHVAVRFDQLTEKKD